LIFPACAAAGQAGAARVDQVKLPIPDRDDPVGLAAFFSVIAPHRERARRSRITLARGLVHFPRMPENLS
jgi:hypothetical protein